MCHLYIFRFNLIFKLAAPEVINAKSEILAIKNLTASLFSFVQPDSDKNALQLLSEKEKELLKKLEVNDINRKGIKFALKKVTNLMSNAFGNQANKTRKLSQILDKVNNALNSVDKNEFSEVLKDHFFNRIRTSPRLLSKNIAKAIQKHVANIETKMKKVLAEARKVFQNSKDLNKTKALDALDRISKKADALLGEPGKSGEPYLVSLIMDYASKDDLQSMNLDTRNIEKKLIHVLEFFKTKSNLTKQDIENPTDGPEIGVFDMPLQLKTNPNCFLDTQVSLAPTHVMPEGVILLNFHCP